MRNFHLAGRSTVHSQNAMVATSHPLAALTAIEVLRAGEGGLAHRRQRSAGPELNLVVLDADRDLHRQVLEARIESILRLIRMIWMSTARL